MNDEQNGLPEPIEVGGTATDCLEIGWTAAEKSFTPVQTADLVMDHNRGYGEGAYRSVDLEDAIRVQKLVLKVRESSVMRDFKDGLDRDDRNRDIKIFEHFTGIMRGLICVRDFPFDILSTLLEADTSINRRCINPLIRANINYWFQLVRKTQKNITLVRSMGEKNTEILMREMSGRGLEFLGPEMGGAFLNRDFRMIDFCKSRNLWIP